MCRLSCSVAPGILVSWPGIKPTALALECWYFTTGPPGKPLDSLILRRDVGKFPGSWAVRTLPFHCQSHSFNPCCKIPQEACAQLLQSCPVLCGPVDCSPPGSSVHEILQARMLKWVAMPFSRGSSRPRDQIHVSWISCIGRQVLYHWATWGSAPGLWQSIYYKKYCLKYLSQSQEVCNGLVQTEEAGGHLSPSSILDV